MPRIIYKNIGETPLQALERFRSACIHNADECPNNQSWNDVPMTYAGRLDPMAEGKLMILIGDECKEKSKYLCLNKEYEVEILLGIRTDTYDALGIADLDVLKFGQTGGSGLVESKEMGKISKVELQKVAEFINQQSFNKYIGKFEQKYPPYSSKTVNGKQLHDLARSNDLPGEMPTKEVEIFSIELLNERKVECITSDRLLDEVISRIRSIKGDFRQDEIIQSWKSLLENKEGNWPRFNVRVNCSSGTYMRSLANTIGGDLGVGGIALHINRTRIG